MDETIACATQEKLVRMTQDHPQYRIDYSFPSVEEQGWLVIKRGRKPKKKFKGKPVAMFAIACEFACCDDGTEALVKVCVVDHNLQVKLEEFVNPDKAIADYRTEITGISAKDLEGVTCSLEDVQKSMKNLLSSRAILLGHILNNDLQLLKLNYNRVIETSYVFKCGCVPINKKPSRSLLHQAVLGCELQIKGNPRNCLDDACAAMKLVLARLDGETDVIREVRKDTEMAKLLLHSIPGNFPSENLNRVIPGAFKFEVKATKAVGEAYSAFAIFRDRKEADEAFENLKGYLEKDSSGRPQKFLTFELSKGVIGGLCVSKVVCDGSRDEITNKKRSLEDESATCLVKKLKKGQTRLVKKPKKEQTCEEPNACLNQCEMHLKVIETLKQERKMHLKEIETLKQELNRKDRKIIMLNAIVELKRRRGI